MSTPKVEGYKSDFISKKLMVEFPSLSTQQAKDVAPVIGSKKSELTYPHFSIVLSKRRRFPFFTATNINGALFKSASRSNNWKLDERVKEFQYGKELYSAPKSDYDKGHMTKREDPQWGATTGEAQIAADSTFHFSNCVPQVKELNQKEWKQLEDYILKTESVPDHLLISVFTGPILKDDDPVFVTKVENEDVQIPTLFWKVIYYTNDNKKLSKVGFLMGQENLLTEKGIVTTKHANRLFERHTPELKEHFMDFKDAKTYQVSLATIETLTGLTFASAQEPYKDSRPIELIIQQVEMKEAKNREIAGLPPKEYHYRGLILK